MRQIFANKSHYIKMRFITAFAADSKTEFSQNLENFANLTGKKLAKKDNFEKYNFYNPASWGWFLFLRYQLYGDRFIYLFSDIFSRIRTFYRRKMAWCESKCF